MPLKIDAPRLRFARSDADGAAPALDLGRPAIADNLRGRVPDAVPVAVDGGRTAASAALALIEDLLFELRAKRRGHEHVAVARIVEGVEDHLEVVLVEQPIRVAAHL